MEVVQAVKKNMILILLNIPGVPNILTMRLCFGVGTIYSQDIFLIIKWSNITLK